MQVYFPSTNNNHYIMNIKPSSLVHPISSFHTIQNVFQNEVLINLIQNQNCGNNKVGVHTSALTLDQLYAI